MFKRSAYILFLLIMSLNMERADAQDPSAFEITRMTFSSPLFSEISPVILENGILFCSNRRFSAIKDRTDFDGRRLYNIYIAEKKDSTRWGRVQELKTERSTFFNHGPLCVASDGKTVYFTSEVETGSAVRKRNFKNRNGIFIAELSGTSLSSLRPFRYNNAQYNIGQPSISHDGKYLFFASDMPGGQGKSDLYYSELINGEWSAPVNLGPRINSPGVENFPYMHSSGRLYFTSDRPGGPGMLDVYSASKYNGEWDDPVLLPDPINSGSDDFAFVISEDMQTGFLASNRSSGDDIFRVTSTIIRKTSCNPLVENSFCYRFTEENAVKFDTLPFRYEWKFGDGTKAEGAVVEHCYSGPGKYIVQLDVVNLITNEVMYNEKTDTLVLENVVQPYISGPDKFIAGKSLSLDAGSTYLPGWEIGQYYWNFGDETVAAGKAVQKTYLRPGVYNVQLIVSTVPEPGGMVREACVSKNIDIISEH